MSDEYGVHNSGHNDTATGWFVGIIVAMALLAIGYLILSANRSENLAADQVRCMIAHPGVECQQITRWEPAS